MIDLKRFFRIRPKKINFEIRFNKNVVFDPSSSIDIYKNNKCIFHEQIENRPYIYFSEKIFTELEVKVWSWSNRTYKNLFTITTEEQQLFIDPISEDGYFNNKIKGAPCSCEFCWLGLLSSYNDVIEQNGGIENIRIDL